MNFIQKILKIFKKNKTMAPISISYRERVIEAAGYLLKKNGGSMSYMKLVKLLYFADRKSIEENEYPITFDNFSNAPLGPIVSTTLDLIRKHQRKGKIIVESGFWDEYFETKGENLKIKSDYPKLKKLSLSDIEILDQIYKENEKLNQYQTAEKSEQLPEWSDPGDSSYPISISFLLTKMGNSEKEAERIQWEIMESSRLDSVFKK